MRNILVFLVACTSVTPTTRTLPTADSRYWPGHDRLTAQLAMCTTPTATDVRVTRSSGDAAFDDAVAHDVVHWAWEPGCRAAKITYVP